MEAVRRLLPGAGLDGLLVTALPSLRWLSGLADLRWILVARRGSSAMPARLAVQAAREALAGSLRIIPPAPGWNPLREELRRTGCRRLGFEDLSMSVAAHSGLTRALSSDVLAVPAGGLVEGLRSVKSAGERNILLKACGITARVASWIPRIISPGMTERELSARVDSMLRLLGADAPAFDTIALAGGKTAMPHGVAGDRKIRKGDLVLVDFGARLGGYHADCTRTFSAGSPTKMQVESYRQVYRAYLAARNQVRPGVPAGRPWEAAMKALGRRGKYFIHGLGHGVGLEIHEAPSLSSGSRDILRKGQFVTVEPGIYIPGWGGIRLEDTVIIGSNGARPATGLLPRELPVAGMTR